MTKYPLKTNIKFLILIRNTQVIHNYNFSSVFHRNNVAVEEAMKA